MQHATCWTSAPEIRQIKVMLGVTTRQVEIYSVNVNAVDRDFAIILKNPKYQQLLELHPHPKGV